MALSRDDHDLRIATPWSIPPRVGLALLMVIVPALMLVDHQAGAGISLRFFYLIPIALAAWVLGMRAGLALAIVSGALCAFVDFGVRASGVPAARIALEGLSGLVLFLTFAAVVARHRRFMDEALALARVDDETGLLSKREFDRVLEAEAKRSKRYRRPLAVLLIDCSGLKDGADASLLAAVGRTVQRSVRGGDLVGRVGPNRLGTILIECTRPLGSVVLERVRERLQESVAHRLRSGNLALSLVTYAGRGTSSGAQLAELAKSQLQLARGAHGIGVAEASVF